MGSQGNLLCLGYYARIIPTRVDSENYAASSQGDKDHKEKVP